MEAFVTTILAWPVNWAPQDTVLCQGQNLAVNQYQAVFSLISNAYGGDGRVNFAIPDLRARVMVGVGQGNYFNAPNVPYATTGGNSALSGFATVSGNILLNANQLPGHTHPANFAPTISPVQVPISQAGSLGVAIQVQQSAPAGLAPQPLTSSPYLANLGAPANARGPYATTISPSNVNLAGVTVTGTPGITASPTVNVVTGGNVAVQSQNTGNPSPVPVQAQGPIGGGNTSNFQPYLAMQFIFFTLGIYPTRP